MAATASLGCCSLAVAARSLARAPRTVGLAALRLSGNRSVVLCAKANSAAPAAGAEKKREPRGITKPKPISPQLQALLGVTEIPRTQALKQIWDYIKANNLQDPDNKKIIVCDEKLKTIFGKDRVGFLEISGLLNPHFYK